MTWPISSWRNASVWGESADLSPNTTYHVYYSRKSDSHKDESEILRGYYYATSIALSRNLVNCFAYVLLMLRYAWTVITLFEFPSKYHSHPYSFSVYLHYRSEAYIRWPILRVGQC